MRLVHSPLVGFKIFRGNDFLGNLYETSPLGSLLKPIKATLIQIVAIRMVVIHVSAISAMKLSAGVGQGLLHDELLLIS